MPAGYGPRPEVHARLRYIENAFWELCSERLYAEGAIPAWAIRRLAREELGITGNDAYERFRHLIRRMDSEYRFPANPDAPLPQQAPVAAEGAEAGNTIEVAPNQDVAGSPVGKNAGPATIAKRDNAAGVVTVMSRLKGRMGVVRR